MSPPPKAFPDLPLPPPFSYIVKFDFHHLGTWKTCGYNSFMGHIFLPFLSSIFPALIYLLKVRIAILKYYRCIYN